MLKVGEVAYLCADEKDSVEREKQMVRRPLSLWPHLGSHLSSFP